MPLEVHRAETQWARRTTGRDRLLAACAHRSYLSARRVHPSDESFIVIVEFGIVIRLVIDRVLTQLQHHLAAPRIKPDANHPHPEQRDRWFAEFGLDAEDRTNITGVLRKLLCKAIQELRDFARQHRYLFFFEQHRELGAALAGLDVERAMPRDAYCSRTDAIDAVELKGFAHAESFGTGA